MKLETLAEKLLIKEITWEEFENQVRGNPELYLEVIKNFRNLENLKSVVER